MRHLSPRHAQLKGLCPALPHDSCVIAQERPRLRALKQQVDALFVEGLRAGEIAQRLELTISEVQGLRRMNPLMTDHCGSQPHQCLAAVWQRCGEGGSGELDKLIDRLAAAAKCYEPADLRAKVIERLCSRGWPPPAGVQPERICRYLQGKIRNTSKDLQRAEVRRARHLEFEGSELTLDQPDSRMPDLRRNPEELGLLLHDYRQFVTLLEHLETVRPDLAQVIRMIHFENMTTREIARQLGVSAGTPSNRSAAGYRLLRQWLQDPAKLNDPIAPTEGDSE